MPSVGSVLRGAREQRGLTIEQVARDTRISQRFLEAIERDEFDALPAPVYVRGFVRSYSSYLRVDAAPLLAELALQGLGGAGGTTAPTPQPEPRASQPAAAPESRRSVDPFARPAAPRAPEPVRREEPPASVPPPPARPAAAAPPPPPPPPERPRTGSAPGRPAPPPPVPPDAFEDGYIRGREPLLRPSEDDSQRVSRIFAIVAAAFFGIIGIAALAYVFTRGDGDDGPAAVAAESPSPSADASVVVVPSQTRAAAGTPGASQTPGRGSPTPATTGTPATATPTGAATTAAATPTPQDSTPFPTPTHTPVTEPTPTTPPTVVPTPTAPATPTPFPTPTPTPTVGFIQPHPYRFQECIGGDCGPEPRRVVCAPDGWFVDVGYDYPVPPDWKVAVVDSQGNPSRLAAVGDAGCAG